MMLVVSLVGIMTIEDIDGANVKVEKTKTPKITMSAKPSCRSCNKMKYKWYTKSFVNYCPHCKRYNTLRKNPKRVHEREYTCSRCGADYCGVCGHDKTGNYRRHRNFVLIPI